VNPIAQLLRNLGSVRLVVSLAVTAAAIGILAFIATRLIEPPMSLLYSGLEARDAGQIVSRLETANVPYELRAGGSQIFVPSDTVLKLRMTLAQDGLPRGGSVGYEIFDKPDSFGTTRAMRDINYLRALEGELARTIGSLAQIRGARVHLVIPRRELFTRDRETPSASIVVDVAGGERLSKSEVAAIQHLTASAVAGLKPSQVSVIDTKGVLLARGGGGSGEAVVSAATAEFKAGLENRLKTQIERLLERSVGLGKVRAEVTADVDFDRIATDEVIFNPDGQVARSTQLVEEKKSATDTTPSEAVTVGNALPDAKAAPAANGPTSTDATDRTEETTNFEISKTVRKRVQESGRIKRLSVAVMVDGTYTTDANGKSVYTPRSADEMKRLTELVRTAVGFDESRGDRVDVANMPFVRVPVPAPEAQSLLALGKGDYFKIAEMAVLLIVGLLVVLLVLRPLATHALVVHPAEARGDAKAALPGPDQHDPQRLAVESAGEEDDAMIDLDQIEGKVKESSLRKINEIVENHPEEALAIVRNWLYQGA